MINGFFFPVCGDCQCVTVLYINIYKHDTCSGFVCGVFGYGVCVCVCLLQLTCWPAVLVGDIISNSCACPTSPNTSAKENLIKQSM